MLLNFADLCLMWYGTIDGYYCALPADLKPRGEQAVCSNSELLTMRVISACLSLAARESGCVRANIAGREAGS